MRMIGIPIHDATAGNVPALATYHPPICLSLFIHAPHQQIHGLAAHVARLLANISSTATFPLRASRRLLGFLGGLALRFLLCDGVQRFGVLIVITIIFANATIVIVDFILKTFKYV